MEPTEDNRRAWDRLQRARVESTTEQAGIPEPIRVLLPDLDGKHVLHELCGSGDASAELAALGALVTAIDVWGPSLQDARERFPNVLFVQADPHALPVNLRRRRFDLVLAGGALPYVHDLGAWVREAASALREGGLLLLYDVHPALHCIDPTTLRWRDDYFAETVTAGRSARRRTLRHRRLAEIVNGVIDGGFAVRRLEELRTLSHVRHHDPRVPGAFALLAEKRPEAGG